MSCAVVDVMNVDLQSETSSRITFDRPVSRHSVHRAAITEVFLTDWQDAGNGLFVVGAQWPRSHGLYCPLDGAKDPMLLGEILRQAGILIAHEAFLVPAENRFIMGDFGFDVDPAYLSTDSTPTNVIVLVKCVDVKWRPDDPSELAGMRCEFTVCKDGLILGSGFGSYHCVSPKRYARLRRYRTAVTPPPAPRPIAGDLVGRDRAADVVLAPAPEPDTWLLRVDPDHPIFFEHPTDHVPGMALLEAMRQAARCLLFPARLLPIGLASGFTRFVEFDSPCLVRAVLQSAGLDGETIIRVDLEQEGRACASGLVTVLPVERVVRRGTAD
jgi:hypothetical protein